jgi:uncharacterized protein YbjT (DUF2867 family)
MSERKTILVTGVTGHQGGAIARHLLAKGYAVTGLTRRPNSEPMKELVCLGGQVAHGDLDDSASVERALKGMWGAYSVQAREVGVKREVDQGRRFAELARKAGVEHFVYGSVASAHRNTGIPYFETKWQIEEIIRGLDFPCFTILRPAFFMENFIGPWFWPRLEEGKLSIALLPRTRLQMIAVDDIGRFGAMAFEKHSDLNRRAIELAGDEMTMPEAAKVLGDALGRTITFDPVPVAEIRKMDADEATMFEWFNRIGLDVDISGLAERNAIRPLTLKEWSTKVKWPVAAHV